MRGANALNSSQTYFWTATDHQQALPPQKLSRFSSLSFSHHKILHGSCTAAPDQRSYQNQVTHGHQNSDSIHNDASFSIGNYFMDENLWSCLPDDLIERILAYLPVANFFRLRTVCKRWKFLAFSRSFVEMRSQVRRTAHEGFFLKIARCRCRVVSSYEPLLNKWYRFPITFLPAQVSIPAAAAKGLLCFMATHYLDGYGFLLVCNPLTRCWRVLPPMIFRRCPFLIAMIVDRNSRNYKIIVSGDYNSDSSRNSTEMYDSATCAWRVCGSVPDGEQISKNFVVCNEHLFCFSRGPQSGLLIFSVQQGIWMKLRTGRLPGYSRFRHLVECKGRIMIVGKALRQQQLGLYIWLLDSSTMRWRQVGKMPQQIYDGFFKSPSECFYCAAQGPLVFLCKFFCEHGLIYNVAQNSWQRMSGCPKIFHPLVIPFEPGLDAVY